MKRKGKFKGHSRVMQIFPVNFDPTAFEYRSKAQRRFIMRPRGLMTLFAGRKLMREMDRG